MLGCCKKKLFFIICLFVVVLGKAQQGSSVNNAISLNLFKVESNSVTTNNRLEAKFVSGITYERKFSKWSWISSLEYGENSINDNCSYCPDYYQGEGLLKELNFYSGYNYTFNAFSESKFKWFTGTDAFLSLMNYSGEFSGGFTGGSYNRNDNYVIVGGLQRLGVSYHPVPQLQFSLITSFRFGYARRRRLNNQKNITNITEVSSTFPLLKVGFLF